MRHRSLHPARAVLATLGTLVASMLLSSCDGATKAAAATTTSSAVAAPQQQATARPATGRAAEAATLQKEPRAIRALYVNRFQAQSWTRMHHFIGIADSTEINALVIDVKDEFGLNWHSSDPMLQKNEGTMNKVKNLPALVDSIRAHGILPIARIVVFKDPVAAAANPQFTIRKPDGGEWKDKKGTTWVNPYNHAIWEYNLRVADEAIRMGFGEIQFDYIRFPEPYPSLPTQVFPGAGNVSKPDLLHEFLTTANARFDKQGVRTTADIFGLVTTVGGPLEVGQYWEKISPAIDVVLPMVYPSHYPHGSFGIASPNADPYRTIFIAISRARQRDEKLGIHTAEHVRPWLQAFTLGAPHYGPEQLLAEKKAVYDAGYDSWVLWSPGSHYDEFLPALEKGPLVSHRRNPPVPMPTGIRID